MVIPAFFNATATLTSVLLVGILYLSGIEIIAGTLTFGTYYLIVAYAQKVISPVLQTGSIVNSLKPVFILAKRIKKHFSLDEDDHNPTLISMPKEISSIKVKNITYRYPGTSQNILTNLSFEATKGDIVLLKGVNGSGKTTLLNILCGEIRQNHGFVLFDDGESDSQCYLSIVRQRSYIFSLTLQENIVLFEPFDKKRYNEILTTLQFDSYFDKDLVSGRTVIQENGNALSGGQIKIISFARCLYRKRPILILDEIFSNLDTNMRNLILNFFQTHREDYISILVEHTNEFDYLANKVLNITDFK